MSSTMNNSTFGGKPVKIEQFDANERLSVQEKLEKKLGPEYISTRPGAGGVRVSYIEGWKAVNLANSIFGFNGWYSEVKNITVDYLDSNNGRYGVGISATIRVILKDGAYHEDIGYGSIENAKTKAAAFEKAKKEAVTDGLKRALRSFGNAMGNCLYDKDYLKRIHGVKVAPPDFDESNLMRFADTAPSTRTNTIPPPKLNEEPSYEQLPPKQMQQAPQQITSNAQPLPPLQHQAAQQNRMLTPAKQSAQVPHNQSSNLNHPNRYPPPQSLRNQQSAPRAAPIAKSIPAKRSLETPTNNKFYQDIDFDDSLTFSDDLAGDSDNDDIDNFLEERRLKELNQPSILSNGSNSTIADQDSTKENQTPPTSISKTSSEQPNTINSISSKEPITNIPNDINRIQTTAQTAVNPAVSEIPAQVGFFTARVAEKVQNNNASTNDHFNPQFISPSMRRTVDPTKSAPIKRTNISPAHSAINNPTPTVIQKAHNSTPSPGPTSVSTGPGLAPNSGTSPSLRFDNPRLMPNRQIGKPRYPPPKRTKISPSVNDSAGDSSSNENAGNNA
ncbi:hypothetical protein WICPIJ_001297 [Wickerhamomyces pijperi]|uniref:DNA repair and recombination protein RAD52 n=1 Tax=Wickerhamomyces pijperi TaxID=599730 RepID=A0A9P8QB66_WICPI|nr:hypothetical protein WICPIJ_001297 [Wickerhamomyces pijperi]